MDCPFCRPQPGEVFLENELVLGIWNAYPVSEGHALLITRRHVTDWFAATPEEQQALAAAIVPTRAAILESYLPAGFNVGLNCGAAAGQTVFHVHLHVVPRYLGTFEPTGELAGLVPHGNKPDRHKPHLFTGWDELIEALGRAVEVQLSGRPEPQLGAALRGLLARGGRLQVFSDVEGWPEGATVVPCQPMQACRMVDGHGRESAFVGLGDGWGYRLIQDQDTRGLAELRARFS